MADSEEERLSGRLIAYGSEAERLGAGRSGESETDLAQRIIKEPRHFQSLRRATPSSFLLRDAAKLAMATAAQPDNDQAPNSHNPLTGVKKNSDKVAQNAASKMMQARGGAQTSAFT